MQRRMTSLLESLINVAIGYSIAILTQIVVFPWFGIEASISDNLLIGAIFTVVSIGRSYLIRRLFNFLHIRGMLM